MTYVTFFKANPTPAPYICGGGVDHEKDQKTRPSQRSWQSWRSWRDGKKQDLSFFF
jgi:hypothetical protein